MGRRAELLALWLFSAVLIPIWSVVERRGSLMLPSWVLGTEAASGATCWPGAPRPCCPARCLVRRLVQVLRGPSRPATTLDHFLLLLLQKNFCIKVPFQIKPIVLNYAVPGPLSSPRLMCS